MGRIGEAEDKYLKAESWGGSGFTAFRLCVLNREAGETGEAARFQRLALKRQVMEIQDAEKALGAAAQAESGRLPFGAPSDSLSAKADSIKGMRGLLRALMAGWMPSDRDTSLLNALLELRNGLPSAPVVHELLAGAYLSRGNFQQALASYVKLLSINPLSLEGQQGQALCYEKLGQADSAFFVLERIVEMNPSDSRAYGPAVRGAEKAGKLPFLASRWEQLLRADKSRHELKKNLIFVWNRLGRNDKVIALTQTREAPE
jgi:tetratricopeptide (TPR) repeat protein